MLSIKFRKNQYKYRFQLRKTYFKYGRFAQGSVSLFATVISASLLSFFLILQQCLGFLAFRVEAQEALRTELSNQLANYDRDLHKRYGLFALSETRSSDLFEQQIRQTQKKPLQLPVSGMCHVQLKETLQEGDEAYRQILAYMRPRLPVSILQEIGQRIQSQKGALTTQVQKNKDDTAKKIESWADKGRWLANLQSEEISPKLAQLLQPFFDYFAWEKKEKGLDPTHLLEGLGRLQSWLEPQALPVYDKLALNEYILDFFSFASEPMGQSQSRGETWRGQKKSELKSKEIYEVECILTGIQSGKTAFFVVETGLLSLRLLQHLSDYAAHSSKRAPFVATATTLSILIAAFTLGTVIIPPKILEGLLIFIRSAYLAYKDIKQLVVGKSVEFQPGFSHGVPIYYKDYLRIFLLLGSPQEHARQAVRYMEKNLGKKFFVQVQVEGSLSYGPWKQNCRVEERYCVGPARKEE